VFHCPQQQIVCFAVLLAVDFLMNRYKNLYKPMCITTWQAEIDHASRGGVRLSLFLNFN
jgi:hypothetical protein